MLTCYSTRHRTEKDTENTQNMFNSRRIYVFFVAFLISKRLCHREKNGPEIKKKGKKREIRKRNKKKLKMQSRNVKIVKL